MNKKSIIIILAIIGICFVFAGSAFAKEDVYVKISTEDSASANQGYIVIILVDSHGKEISSKGTIHYNITDEHGKYNWAYKPYDSLTRLKYGVGTYEVVVKFDGDSRYNPVKFTKIITLTSANLGPDYYDGHNWGLNQEVDDYMDDNYWDEELYDDPFTYDGEGY